jgi:hypothetical protein
VSWLVGVNSLLDTDFVGEKLERDHLRRGGGTNGQDIRRGEKKRKKKEERKRHTARRAVRGPLEGMVMRS